MFWGFLFQFQNNVSILIPEQCFFPSVFGAFSSGGMYLYLPFVFMLSLICSLSCLLVICVFIKILLVYGGLVQF